MSTRSLGSHQSARALSHDWLTPPEILAALGDFDLDPAAAPDPRPWPTAVVHWTEGDDGLVRQWFGRVWLNPPFGPARRTAAFMQRMVAHNRGTALLAARTETALFFATVWQAARAVLFLRGRPYFHHPNGARGHANSGAPIVLVAYGADDADRLADCGLPGAFLRLGPGP